jgi:outer membrane protein assembly factor BamA
VQPRLLVRRVEAVGNSVLDSREVLRLVGVHEDSELSPEDFPKWVADIQKAYAERGYPFARASIVVRDMDDLTYKVVRVEINEGEPLRIAEVRFEGERLPARRGMGRILGFGVGDIADLSRIESGLTRAEEELRRQGYYRAMFDKPRIEPRKSQALVVLPAFVGPPYEVQFTGNAPLKPSELFEHLALHEERISSDANLRALEQKLAELYRRYSFRDVAVKMSERLEQRQLRSEDGKQKWEEEVMVLDVQIRTGAQTEVDLVTFPGASHFDAKLLRTQLYSYLEEDLPGSALREPVDSELADQLGFSGGSSPRRRTVPKPILLDPRRMFYAPSYEQGIEHLRELYRADGFLDVKIGEPRFEALSPTLVQGEPSDPRQHVVGVISIDEGPRTFVYDVRIEHNKELTDFELLTAAGLARKTPFSYLKLEEARLRVVEACQEKGHFFAKVEPDVRLSDDGTRAEVIFVVDEGYVLRVGAIEVRGHDRSSRAMILDRVRFKPGDLYRPSLARESQDLLLALDVFTSVTVAPEEADLPARLKTLVVSVTERKTQWLGWSAGFSTGEGTRGGFEYGYRNLLGSAIHASLRGQIGFQFVFLDKEIQRRYETLDISQRIEYQSTLTLGIPYLPKLPKNTGSVDLTALADIQRDYRIQKQSAVLTFVYRPFKRLTVTASQELENSNFTLLATNLETSSNIPLSSLVPNGQNTLLATQLAVTYDLRDRAYNPRRGVLISLQPEYDTTLSAGESDFGDSRRRFRSNMFRLMGSFAFYIPLGKKLTFASQWRYGRIVHLEKGSASYPNRLFYLGGPNFRGYNINAVVPQDVKEDAQAETKNIVSHGGQTVLAGQSELRFPIYGDLYGGIFTDIGNLWLRTSKFDIRDLLYVVGAGLRLQTPVASLAFDYGVRDVTRRLHFVGAFQFAFQTF